MHLKSQPFHIVKCAHTITLHVESPRIIYYCTRNRFFARRRNRTRCLKIKSVYILCIIRLSLFNLPTNFAMSAGISHTAIHHLATGDGAYSALFLGKDEFALKFGHISSDEFLRLHWSRSLCHFKFNIRLTLHFFWEMQAIRLQSASKEMQTPNQITLHNYIFSEWYRVEQRSQNTIPLNCDFTSENEILFAHQALSILINKKNNTKKRFDWIRSHGILDRNRF